MISKYEPRITRCFERDNSYYALVVMVDYDGTEHVVHGYKGRHFSSRKAAEKSTAKYIEKAKGGAQ